MVKLVHEHWTPIENGSSDSSDTARQYSRLFYDVTQDSGEHPNKLCRDDFNHSRTNESLTFTLNSLIQVRELLIIFHSAGVNVSYFVVQNTICTILFTSFAPDFEVKSSFNKRESCNDNASVNPAFGQETQLASSQPRGGGKGGVSPLSLGAGTPRARLLSRAQAIWLAVNVVRYMMVTDCFFAPSTVKQNKIHCSHQGSKWNLHSSPVEVFPFWIS